MRRIKQFEKIRNQLKSFISKTHADFGFPFRGFHICQLLERVNSKLEGGKK